MRSCFSGRKRTRTAGWRPAAPGIRCSRWSAACSSRWESIRSGTGCGSFPAMRSSRQLGRRLGEGQLKIENCRLRIADLGRLLKLHFAICNEQLSICNCRAHHSLLTPHCPTPFTIHNSPLMSSELNPYAPPSPAASAPLIREPGPDKGTWNEQFLSARPRAYFAMALTAGYLVASLVVMLAMWNQVGLLERVAGGQTLSTEEANANDMFARVSGIGAVVLALGSMIVMLFWI